jgi:hypothetical protein
MQRLLIATLMALFFGLFSMPACAVPANGWAGCGSQGDLATDTIHYAR